MTRPLIAVIGDRSIPESDPRRVLATELGKVLISEGYAALTGGIGDLARCVAVGARSSGKYREGALVAVLPGFDPASASDVADTVLATGLDHARNLIVSNSDAVVAIGGGAGTLSEIAHAWALHRLVIAYRVAGWSGRLAGTRVDDRVRYPEIADDQVYGVDGASDVINLLRNLLPLYRRRHTRIPDG
ncbi:MAG TPA: acyl-CoA synthetase [Thermoplasmata archaeon]|nr:acyl-CoA synthetase [Thermoplasmata archaeon]HZY91374.1 acyl-CoA synthetase [Thermoplasmata archaeon]